MRGVDSERETRESTKEVSFTSHSILDSTGFLSYREITDEDIVQAALEILDESVGRSPTITVTDIFDRLIGTRGSTVWELARERNVLSSRKISKALTSYGFVNISRPHRTARYQLPEEDNDFDDSLCPSCRYDDECDHSTGFFNDSGVCGSYENKNPTGVSI